MAATEFSDEIAEEADPRVLRSRAKLLTAATELLVEAGPRSVTVDAVAERSGVAKSTLYRQWSSRNELLVDVLRCHVVALEEPDADLDFESALRALLHSVADAMSAPEAARVMPALLTLQVQIPELAELVVDDRRCKVDVVAAVLDRGVREGRLPANLDAERAAQVLIGPLMVAAIFGGGNHDVHELADHVVERFVRSYDGVA